MASQSPAAPQESLVQQLLAVHIAMITLAAVTVVTRIATRLRLTSSGLGSDDWTILISLAFALTFVTINCYQTKFGLGQHIHDLPHDIDFTKSQELFYFGEMIYYITVGLTKIAILLLYLRLIPQRSYRVVIYIFIAFVTGTVLASVLANIFQCNPVAFAWNKEIEGGTCFNQTALYYSNAALDIFQDIFIYCLPLRVIYDLQVPKRQKVALGVIFAIGGFVCITGIVRLSSLKTAAVTDDPTWYNVGAAEWSVIEISVGIVCASLPHLKPLVAYFFPRLIGSSPDSRVRPPPYIKTGSRRDVELNNMAVSKSARHDDNEDYGVMVEAFSRQEQYSGLDRLAHAQQGAERSNVYKSTSLDVGSN